MDDNYLLQSNPFPNMLHHHYLPFLQMALIPFLGIFISFHEIEYATVHLSE